MKEREEAAEAGPSTSAGRIIRIIRDGGPLSPADIARRSGFAKSTVSLYVERLLSAGLVREEIKSGGKRRTLKVAESAGYVVGVDLGQTHLNVGLCDLEANILETSYGRVDFSHQGPEAVLDRIVEATRALVSRSGFLPAELFGVGVGLPGPVDYIHGVPVSPPVMPGWDRFPVASQLARELACPVFVDNDANVMALAEREKGVADGERDFMVVKAGSGIGAGIVVDGRIYRGAKGAAGDIGHIGIDGVETLCRCGNRGCLEAVAGGKALTLLAEEAARSGSSPFLASHLAAGKIINPELLALGAAHGDEECLHIVIDAGKALGNVLAKLVNFFNPSLIVIGGGLSDLGERYLASIRESIYHRSTPLATSDLVIKRSGLRDRAGVTGAAVLVLDEIFSQRNVGRLMRDASQ